LELGNFTIRRIDLDITQNIDVLILAGGLGKRLRSIVSDRPKPMALVKGKPFLEYLILQVRLYGFRRIILSTGYLGNIIQDYFADGHQWNVEIIYSQEQEPLGTGGAVKFAEPLILSNPVLVMNGDSLVDVNLKSFLDFHFQHQAKLSIVLTEVEDARRYGTVVTDSNERVIRFVEKSDKPVSNQINAGVYLLSREVISEIPKNQQLSLEYDVFPKDCGKDFYGMSGTFSFLDIGQPESYAKAEQFVELRVRFNETDKTNYKRCYSKGDIIQK